MINNKKYRFGFTIIEVLIACSIISVSMFALMQTAQKGVSLSDYALRKSQSSLLLEEGVEAVKTIRDNSWAVIETLNLDTPYYLYFNSNTRVWVLDIATPSLSGHIPTYPIDQIFDRTVTISSVARNDSDDILESGGIIDSRTKKVTINVTWPSHNDSNSQSLSFYIADIFN